MPRILLAHAAVQCTASIGEVGTFLYDPAEGASPRTGKLLSPVFADSADLYRFAEARGWTFDRTIGPFAMTRTDEPVEVAVADLYAGDMLDLEGDPYADKTPEGAPNEFEFEMATVWTLEDETADCRLVETSMTTVGFPPAHKVKVCAFEPSMVEGVTGSPAVLTIRGIALT